MQIYIWIFINGEIFYKCHPPKLQDQHSIQPKSLTKFCLRKTRKILSGRQSKQRQGEMSLAVTLISVVFMHILCNILRIFLGVLVVVLVGEQWMKSVLTLVQKSR